VKARLKKLVPFKLLTRRRYERLKSRRDEIIRELINAQRQRNEALHQRDEAERHLRLAAAQLKQNESDFLDCKTQSRSQGNQELFVLLESEFKKGGYFVEFGAADGIIFSNTYFLEKNMGWKGILAEPAKCWHEPLRINRDAHVEYDCVWTETGETLLFNEVNAAILSTIDSYSANDSLRDVRRNGHKYAVPSISLNDLLKKHNAPTTIDFLSIDTEGSEYDILKNFDFDKYRISIISCEHNFQPVRADIYQLLTSKGYERKYEDMSQNDDWYVKIS
jgi:FkbM family methyltransferase